MQAPHVLVLVVDGLRASAVGAYGASGGTPALDQLASKAKLYDWFFANAPELESVYAALWGDEGHRLAGFLGAGEYQSALVCDDELVVSLSGASRFDTIRELVTPTVAVSAESPADTWFAGAIGEFAEAITECRAQARTSRPLCVWMHTKGMFGPWDAPRAVIEAMLDEEDASIAPSVLPASGRVTDTEPDAAFEATCRYAAQAQVMDACLGQFFEFVDARFGDQPTVLAFLGARGYSLGEHSVIGCDDRLYAESLHIPLLIRRNNGDGALVRVARPFGPASLLGMLSQSADSAEEETPTWQASTSGAAAVQHGEWRLIRPAGGTDAEPLGELYLKPDDRWEANDVASLMPDAAERMLALLSLRAGFDVAEPGDSK